MKQDKFYFKLFAIALLCLSIFSLLIGGKNYIVGYADSEVTIGTLYTIEHVSQTTKVYVIGPTLDRALAAGRTVYQELSPHSLDNHSDPCETDDLELTADLTVAPTIIRYFYYATPSEPKLTGSSVMKNDYHSLVYALQYLESEATYYAKNAVLGYIRGINSSYKTREDSYESSFFNHYGVVCGSFSSTLINHLKNINPGGMKINEYFASFLSDQNLYDETIYGTCNSYYLNLNLELVNPASSNVYHTIDLLHMFASLDGIFESTGVTYRGNMAERFIEYVLA